MKELCVNGWEQHLSGMLLPNTADMDDDVLIVKVGLSWQSEFGQDATVMYDYYSDTAILDTGDEYIRLVLDDINESYMMGLQDGTAARHNI